MKISLPFYPYIGHVFGIFKVQTFVWEVRLLRSGDLTLNSKSSVAISTNISAMASSETLPLLVEAQRTYHGAPRKSNSRTFHHYVSLSVKELGQTCDINANEQSPGTTSVWVGFALIAFSAICFATCLTAVRFLQLRDLLTPAQVGFLISVSLLIFFVHLRIGRMVTAECLIQHVQKYASVADCSGANGCHNADLFDVFSSLHSNR